MRILCETIRDNFYPKRSDPTRRRNAVRGIVLDDCGRVFLMHIQGRDIFGERDHFELPGGGIETGESMEQALRRELLEEIGWEIDAPQPVGIIANEYNLLQRVDVQHFFLARATRFVGQRMTEYERGIVREVVRVPSQEILSMYDSRAVENVGVEIHARDRIAVAEALRCMEQKS